MSNSQLVMRWVPVLDAAGRTHMESCWITTAQVAVSDQAASIQAASIQAEPPATVTIHHAA